MCLMLWYGAKKCCLNSSIAYGNLDEAWGSWLWACEEQTSGQKKSLRRLLSVTVSNE